MIIRENGACNFAITECVNIIVQIVKNVKYILITIEPNPHPSKTQNYKIRRQKTRFEIFHARNSNSNIVIQIETVKNPLWSEMTSTMVRVDTRVLSNKI